MRQRTEMALEHQVDLHNDTIVMYVAAASLVTCHTNLTNRTFTSRVWISADHVGAVAQKGLRLIHAATEFFYLDCGGGGWLGNNINGDSSCGTYKTWQKAYSFDPRNGLDEDQFDLVMGGTFSSLSSPSIPLPLFIPHILVFLALRVPSVIQCAHLACPPSGQQLLWAEQSGPSNLDSRTWPRAASSAEVFWSGPGGDVRTALPRLHEVGFRFVRRGVAAIPLQPEWCAYRPGACDVDA
jgi:hexosaminidase